MSLSHVQLLATPQTAACLVSMELMMPSNHLILCCPQSFPASGSFPTSQLSTSDGKSIGASASVPPSPRSTNLLRVTTNPERFIPSAHLSSEDCRELASLFSCQMHGRGVLEVARTLSTPPQLSCHLPTTGSDHTSLISWTMTAPCQASGRTSACTVAGLPRLLSTPCPPTWEAQSCQTSWCNPAERPWIPCAARHSAASVSLLLLPLSRPVPKHLSSKHLFASMSESFNLVCLLTSSLQYHPVTEKLLERNKIV